MLKVEVEALWALDARGRVVSSRSRHERNRTLLVIGNARDGRFALAGSNVPADRATELERTVAAGPLSADPATPSASLARCEQLLSEAFGAVETVSGPSYVIPPGTSFAPVAEILRSDGEHAERLLGRAPQGDGHWDEGEWRQLLDGSLGPWAMAVSGEKVISLCHCARLTDHAAEAGVWTAPDFRGQGHAAAVTAAWAALLRPGGRHPFYSTSADNGSSQRVAARLGLRPIGWIWAVSG